MSAAAAPSADPGLPAPRLARLRPYEILIFIVLAVLVALCLTAASVVVRSPHGRAGPLSGEAQLLSPL